MAAGMAAGYLLGRTRKAKLAIAVASFALGRRVQPNPKALLKEGLSRLGSSPQFGQVKERVRGELTTNGRSAVDAVLKAGCDAVADTLASCTRSLGSDQEARGDGDGDQSAGRKNGERRGKRNEAREPTDAGGDDEARDSEDGDEAEEGGGEDEDRGGADQRDEDAPAGRSPAGRKPGERLPTRRGRPLRPVRSSTPRVGARRGGGH